MSVQYNQNHLRSLLGLFKTGYRKVSSPFSIFSSMATTLSSCSCPAVLFSYRKMQVANWLLISYSFLMLSISLTKLVNPLFWLMISSSKLKFLLRLIYQPSQPDRSSAFLLTNFAFFLSLRFSYFKELRNSAQLFLISLKMTLACQSRSFSSRQLGMDSLLIMCRYTTDYINIVCEWMIQQQIMQGRRKIWLDCDPGHDDMLAIIMAALSDGVELMGVSASAGNSFIENTTQNALDILHEIGRDDIAVIRGAAGPLCGRLEVAPNVHGVSGLEGAELLKSPHRAIEERPFLQIYNRIMACEDRVEFVVTGAMTNLAILLRGFPDIRDRINAVTIMGGAIGLGNWSPAAEFNILVDPEAAQIVFHSKLPITMVPLELTHTNLVTEDIFSEFDTLKSNFGKKMGPLFRYFQKGYKKDQNFDFPVAHDPCTIYYLLHPEDFVSRRAFVEIELQGKSRGRTNCFFRDRAPNATVCEKMVVDRFWKAMLGCLRRIK